MRSTFMGFETTKRGLQINQKGLDIVGHNIANLGVTGYTRQRVDQVSISYQGMGDRFSLGNKATLAGNGANMKGIAQLRDPYLDKRFRQENSDLGFYGKNSEILADLATALDDMDNNGLLEGIKKFQNAISSLQATSNVTNANVVRTTAMSLTQVLQQYDQKLNNIISQEKFDLEINVKSVNTILQRVALLNDSIAKELNSAEGSKNATYGPNELLDERNVLLDELSQYGDIQITTNSDLTVDVTMGGHSVVKGGQHESLDYRQNTDGTVTLGWQSTGKEIALGSGLLKASVNMINGRGPHAQGNENFERGVPYYREQIDSFARTLVDTFNKVLPEIDDDGDVVTDAAGDPVYKTLFVMDQVKGNGASAIRISDDWNKSAEYILSPKSKDGKEDKEYYQSMLSQFDKQLTFDSGFSGTLTGFVNEYGTTLSEDKNFNDSRLDASSSIAGSVLDAISQVSGVSMDEEGADMMAYTKAYGAMSRVMTAMDEALDTLINRTGLVGR